MYMACGLDPARCEIFVQSHVTAHSQLCWILETLTPMGWLDRMTQFKARAQAQGRERINTGVFTYPVLMAADILLYDADFVPVGEDQRQHIELCRDLANRLNSQRGDVLKVPAPLISDVGARVMGLDTPDEKMSKSIAAERAGPRRDAARSARRGPSQDRARHHRHRARGAQARRCRRGQPPRDLRGARARSARMQRSQNSRASATARSRVPSRTRSSMRSRQSRLATRRSAPTRTDFDRVLADSAARVRIVADATLLRVQEAVGLR